MLSKNQRIVYKTFFGLLGFSALVTEVVVLVERGMFMHVRFFSYFTVLTNILVCITLLASASLTALGRQQAIDKLRAAATVYILIVGVGFTVLLSRLTNLTFAAVPWDNIVLHYIMPVAMLFDFLQDPPRSRIGWPTALTWLAYPLLYLGISLIRGLLTGWYPYPFLNPALVSLDKITMIIIGLFGFVLLLEYALLSYLRVRQESRSARRR